MCVHDNVSRLLNSTATAVGLGTVHHNLSYGYDGQWGNGTCKSGSVGYCALGTYNSFTNHVATLGSTSVSYDGVAA